MFKDNLKAVLYLAIAGLITACGGSGSGSGGNGSNPLAGKELSIGTITGFGSVHVNDTRYDTSSAAITSDDRVLGNVTDLKVDMVARVSSDSLVASQVSYEEDVKAPSDAPITDLAAMKTSAFSVMGQMVVVDGMMQEAMAGLSYAALRPK